MRKAYQIFIWIFCLVIVLLPTQGMSAFAQKEISCCITQNEHQDEHCCHNESSSGTSNQHCENDCIKVCSSCFYVFILTSKENEIQEETTAIIDKKGNFSYRSPHIVSSIRKIWQPPRVLM